MRKGQLNLFLRISLAHHPLCWHYRLHTIRFRGISLCLGCTGFYIGVLIGSLIVLLKGVVHLDWFGLVIVATIMASPTILRLMNIPFFKSQDKLPRFIFRWLLGIGVIIGLVSIIKAPNVFIGLGQLILGAGLYLGISLNRIRSKDLWNGCQDCTFTISPDCPGLSPYYFRKDSTTNYQVKDQYN